VEGLVERLSGQAYSEDGKNVQAEDVSFFKLVVPLDPLNSLYKGR